MNWPSGRWFCLHSPPSPSLSQPPQPRVKDFITFLCALFAHSDQLFRPLQHSLLKCVTSDCSGQWNNGRFSSTSLPCVPSKSLKGNLHILGISLIAWLRSSSLTSSPYQATSVDHQSCVLGLKCLLCGWRPAPTSSPVPAIPFKSLSLLHEGVSSLIVHSDYLSKPP